MPTEPSEIFAPLFEGGRLKSAGAKPATSTSTEQRPQRPVDYDRLLPGDATLAEAKEWLSGRMEDGEKCPCCGQLAKVYWRSLNSGMVHSLITMYRLAGTEWIHVPTQIGARSREEGKLRHWGLVEELREKREDGGRQGYWRVTPLGELFVTERVEVHKYARIFDNQLLGLEGDLVTIRDALGEKFSLEELMSAKNDVPSELPS